MNVQNLLPTEQVIALSLTTLHPFPKHPFQVRDDNAMLETTESIRANGVITPIIVRPCGLEGDYEIISGHRRKHACETIGLPTIPTIIRELDDDAAIILMVDSNIQRKNILPTERAYAYQMRMEAIKHQGARSDLTCNRFGYKLDPANSSRKSIEEVANQVGDSRTQIQRYIRLTHLSPELQEMVNNNRLIFSVAVELSYLNPDEQNQIGGLLDKTRIALSIAQAKELKQLSQAGQLDPDKMQWLLEKRPKQLKVPAPDSPQKRKKKTPKTEPCPPAPVVEENVEEPPFIREGKTFSTLQESIEDMKNPEKDCSCTPNSFLEEMQGFVEKFGQELDYYRQPYYTAVYEQLTTVQVLYLQELIETIVTYAKEFYQFVSEGSIQT